MNGLYGGEHGARRVNAVEYEEDGDVERIAAQYVPHGEVERTDAARRFEETLEGLYDVTMRLIGVVIGLAPLGVAEVRLWETPGCSVTYRR